MKVKGGATPGRWWFESAPTHDTRGDAMPGPNSKPIGGKTSYVRQHGEAKHGDHCFGKDNSKRTCVHAPTKRARKIMARKTGIGRLERPSKN